MSRLESLPNDLISEIISRVGAHSREDLTNCMLTCKELCGSVNDPKIFRQLDISPLKNNPTLSVGRYEKLMDKCLLHSNPSAQYVKGIVEYFEHDNTTEGLRYLKDAADALVKEAVYLYEIVMLLNENFGEGRHYMEKLSKGGDRTEAFKCWSNIRISMQGIWFIRKPIYYDSLDAMRTPFICETSSCDHCYYFKQMFNFMFNI